MFAADIYQVYNIKQMTAIEKLPQNASAKLNQEKKLILSRVETCFIKFLYTAEVLTTLKHLCIAYAIPF